MNMGGHKKGEKSFEHNKKITTLITCLSSGIKHR